MKKKNVSLLKKSHARYTETITLLDNEQRTAIFLHFDSNNMINVTPIYV